MNKYDLLEELALANALSLFELWGLEYKQISPDEYDFLNPTRNDKNFGACRFNIKKGKGADFAGFNFSQTDFKNLGLNFDKEDFLDTKGITNWGFSIIGLCQRLHQCKNYKEAATLIHKQLTILHEKGQLFSITQEHIEQKQEEARLATLKKLRVAERTWNSCRFIDDTLAEKYLHSRGIYLLEQEPNVKFHPKILNMETKKFLPALLCKVQKAPDSELVAIHRIYLKHDGSGKALVSEPKMALGDIKGAAVWLGTPCEELCIAEGPENALAIRSLGYRFVLCTVNSANFSGIILPEIVKKVILFPDPDEAGILANRRAFTEYTKQKRQVKTIWPPKNNKNPKWDWADELKSRGIDV